MAVVSTTSDELKREAVSYDGDPGAIRAMVRNYSTRSEDFDDAGIPVTAVLARVLLALTACGHMPGAETARGTGPVRNSRSPCRRAPLPLFAVLEAQHARGGSAVRPAWARSL